MKTSRAGGPAFVWLCGLVTLPVSLVLLVHSATRGALTGTWWAGLVSMVLHTAYAVTLQKAYAAGEFSTVYPVSRGTAPVLVTVAAIPWLGGSGPWVFVGAALVLGGVLLMDGVHSRRLGRGIALGLAVASCTAAYTLWDGFSVTSLGVGVLTYLAVANVAQVVVLSALVRKLDCTQWRRAVPIAVLTPASYGLVLLALSVASVDTVAIGRTLNVVLGALLGAVVLHERLTPTRIAGLTTIIAGVLLVST
ncbi:DMT family transporter [Kribbella sp. NBC_01484]|uniref:DMT family transporter n=1 Tax=Kribbella sp. NBC_01484 TaxID=2903579 RepID=UPI002E363E20|nr:DMT family transporter [Kribbella sp. NBC_01484]